MNLLNTFAAASLDLNEAWNLSWGEGIQFILVLAFVYWLKVQIGGAVWFAAQLESRVYNLETEDYSSQLQMIKENRRYIKEVIMASYKINPNWENPYYQVWIDAGGWNDKMVGEYLFLISFCKVDSSKTFLYTIFICS